MIESLDYLIGKTIIEIKENRFRDNIGNEFFLELNTGIEKIHLFHIVNNKPIKRISSVLGLISLIGKEIKDIYLLKNKDILTIHFITEDTNNFISILTDISEISHEIKLKIN